MRITGGSCKGRILSSLKGLSIRPTSDKVRGALFNIIGQDTAGMTVLDLFAGTGSFGIEALSRGALWTLFIDNSSLSVKIIHRNLILCGLEKSGSVLKRDLRKGLPVGHPKLKKGFDLVFIDPPYGRNLIPPLLKELSESEILTSTSIVVAESLKKDTLPNVSGKLRLVDARIYGETKIDIFYSEGL